MISIGLVGGIASGKSEVARLLSRRGAHVVDADLVAHETYAPGTPGYEALLAAFGNDLLAADGTIDRQRLGEIVFKDPAHLKQLTDIVWPLARARVEALQREAAAQGLAVFVLEAPLLLEAGWRGLVDQVWLVRAADAAVRERLRGRGLSPEDVEARLAARQVAAAEATADLVIENDGDLQALERAVDDAGAKLTQTAGKDANGSPRPLGEG